MEQTLPPLSCLRKRNTRPVSSRRKWNLREVKVPDEEPALEPNGEGIYAFPLPLARTQNLSVASAPNQR